MGIGAILCAPNEKTPRSLAEPEATTRTVGAFLVADTVAQSLLTIKVGGFLLLWILSASEHKGEDRAAVWMS